MVTSNAVTIAGVNVTSILKTVDIWQEINTVSRFSVVLRNAAGAYSTAFDPDDNVDINLAGADMLNGWVDITHPIVDQEPDVFTQTIEVSGRGYGRELVDLTVDKYYGIKSGTNNLWYALDIVDDLLSEAGSSITYTSPEPVSGPHTRMAYDARDSTLLDGLRRILNERLNYDFYVDETPALQTFAVGTLATGITLKSVADSETNNILRFVWDSNDGTNIKNYVWAKAGELNDGWTEFNASDWDAASGGTVSDSGNRIAGLGSIQFNLGAASDSYMELDINNGGSGRYGRTYIELDTLPGVKKLEFQVQQNTYDEATQYYYVELFDSGGHRIQFRKSTQDASIPTGYRDNERWVEIKIPIGPGVQDIQDNVVYDWWYYVSGSSFDWKIYKIRIGAVAVADAPVDDFRVDDLKMPIMMVSLAQDATSQTNYGVRKLIYTKTDVGTQAELDEFTADTLAEKKDPYKQIRIYALGSAGITAPNNYWTPGKTLTLNIPGESINSETWRIISVHHMFDFDNPQSGVDYYVEVICIPNTLRLDMKTYERLNKSTGILHEIRDLVKWMEAEEEKGIAYPSPPPPQGMSWHIQHYDWKITMEAENQGWVIRATGTERFSDSTASAGYAIRREATDSAGVMWTTVPMRPGSSTDLGYGSFYAWYRMKVADNTSGSAILTLQIYDESAASVIKSATIYPDMFPTAGAWYTLGLSFNSVLGHEYRFRGNSFVDGITDISLDWITVTDFRVPLSTTGISLDAVADVDDNKDNDDADNVRDDSDNDNNASNDDNDSTQSAGSHGHSYSTVTGRLPTSLTTRYAHTSSNPDSSLSSFLAVTNTSYNQYVTGINQSGSHTHGVTSPTHDHSISSPDHDHGITSPDHDHGQDSEEHTHPEDEGHGHEH